MVTDKTGWRSRLWVHLWIGAGVVVGLSALSYVAARLTVGATYGWILDEVHQNLSVAIDLVLPTWYATALWALLGLLAWVRGFSDAAHKWAWRLFAVVAWVASVDEYLMLHERLNGPAARIEEAIGIDLGGVTWIILGAVVVVAVAVSLGRLVLSLPRRARGFVLAGGAVFLLGAIGFELVHNLIERDAGIGATGAVIAYHFEEAMEKAGVILAIGGLLDLLPTAPTAPIAVSVGRETDENAR